MIGSIHAWSYMTVRKSNYFMNPPQREKYQADIRNDGMFDWAVCPYCGKKAFRITPGAVIKGQFFKCRGSNCKQEFEVNYDVRAM